MGLYNINRTDKKENEIFLIIRNSDGIGFKVIQEEGLPNMFGNAQILNPLRGVRKSYMTLQPILSSYRV
jgi:hypothetical protein